MNRSGLIDIFQCALEAADPYRAVMRHVSLAGDLFSAGDAKYDLGKFKRIIVIGAGKGTAPMAQAVEAVLGNRIDRGIIIVKYGHTRPLRTIIQREAAHPLPDDAGVKATAEIRKLLKEAGEDSLVLCLFSGGASSLLVAPIEGISLDEKRETTKVLLSAGAGINELNAVRKHLSAVKGGRLAEAAHPLPDDAGVKATAEIRKLLSEAGEDSLVLCLFSGGASSLLVAPIEGISLDEKRETTNVLLSAGAGINELNAVRKHLSAVKGGRLAETAYPAAVLALVLSDVIGDRLDVIASGPTVPDSTNFMDALAVIHKYSLEKKIPASVLSVLHVGVAGILPDTPKAGAFFFQNTRNIVVGNIRQSLDAARTRAEERGYGTELISADLQGEAREVAHLLVAKAITVRSSMRPGSQPRCLLFGGETTVTVKGKGTGGRNQELALAFAVEIAGIPGITLLSAGTDGTDGPTDAAGAVVDGETLPKSYAAGLDAAAHLKHNDSYSFFSRLDALTGGAHHLKTGPTGTNVMDLQIILIER